MSVPRPLAPRGAPIDPARLRVIVARPEFPQLSTLLGLYGLVVLLHLVGGTVLLYYKAQHPALIGLGLAAYFFGLRHAFDADHIAAIDDTVRLMLHEGRRPLGVGFFFALGHSTVVLLLAVVLVLAAAAVKTGLPGLRSLGGLMGAGVSGVFLWVAGILNLLVLLELLQLLRKAGGHHCHVRVAELLAKRGLLKRLLGTRVRFITRSWQMYPLGLLFGLGFDTASEVGLLAITAGAASGALPWPAALSLPVLFAAGMSAMDTTDGVLMTLAYDWACRSPARTLAYNLFTTLLSAGVALVIGSIELLQVGAGLSGLHGGVFDRIAKLDFGALGYVIVGVFMVSWASVAIWKRTGMEKTADAAVTQPRA